VLKWVILTAIGGLVDFGVRGLTELRVRLACNESRQAGLRTLCSCLTELCLATLVVFIVFLSSNTYAWKGVSGRSRNGDTSGYICQVLGRSLQIIEGMWSPLRGNFGLMSPVGQTSYRLSWKYTKDTGNPIQFAIMGSRLEWL